MVEEGGRYRRWLLIVMSMLMCGAMFAPSLALAQDSTVDVEVDVTLPADGVLSASITHAEITIAPLEDQTATERSGTGTATLSMTDTTGVGSAWTVRVTSGGFLTDASGFVVPITVFGLGLDPGHPTVTGVFPARIPTVVSALTVVSTEMRPIATCTEGNCQGRFVATLEVKITVPAWIPAGTYATSLGVEIVSEPDTP